MLLNILVLKNMNFNWLIVTFYISNKTSELNILYVQHNLSNHYQPIQLNLIFRNFDRLKNNSRDFKWLNS